MYVCTYVCMYVRMYVCMYVCMYACIDGWVDVLIDQFINGNTKTQENTRICYVNVYSECLYKMFIYSFLYNIYIQSKTIKSNFVKKLTFI